MILDIDTVQFSVRSSGTFVARTSGSVMLCCARPRPERKCGLFKQCRLPSRLFRLGSLDPWVCVYVCVRAHVTVHSWLSSPAVFRKDLPGEPSVTKNKIPQIFGSWLCVVSPCLSCDLDSPWHVATLSSPPFLSGDFSVWQRDGRLPYTWF